MCQRKLECRPPIFNMIYRRILIKSHGWKLTLKSWPATRSPIQLFVDLLQLFPQRINMHTESCSSWQYLCGCALCLMFAISKAWKVAVRPTKPKCCHYRLLGGTSTLSFAHMALVTRKGCISYSKMAKMSWEKVKNWDGIVPRSEHPTPQGHI